MPGKIPKPACSETSDHTALSPPQKCVRPYNLGRRKEAQDATRQRILDLSATRLIEQGSQAFTIDAVAREAGVTRQTVHNLFGTRAGLLEAVSSQAVDGRAFADMPQAFEQTDALRGIELFGASMCRFWADNRLFVRRLRGLAATEPELEPVVRAHDERRLGAIRGFVAHYGLTSEEEADHLIRNLFALTSFELFDVLAGEKVGLERVIQDITRLLRHCLHTAVTGRN